MTLICPQEVQETATALHCANRVVENAGPVDEVRFFDLRQSMNNGGGPACLRLRVVVTEEELETLGEKYRIRPALVERLGNWIESHYRDELSQNDLADPSLADQSQRAMEQLRRLLDA